MVEDINKITRQCTALLIVSQLINVRYVLFHMMRDVNADRQQTAMAK